MIAGNYTNEPLLTEVLVEMNLPFDRSSCTLESFPVYFCRLAFNLLNSTNSLQETEIAVYTWRHLLFRLSLEWVLGTGRVHLCDPLVALIMLI